MKIKGKYIVIAVLVAIIALMYYCSPVSPEREGEGEFVKYSTHIDTTYVPGIPDTVHFYDTIKRYVDVPVMVPYYDTISNLNVYDNPYEDSLISGYIHSEIDGVLVWQNLTYTPKFPKFIYQTDTLRINKVDSVIITNPRKIEFYAGLEFGGNPTSFSVSPKISLVDKRMNQFSYRYDLINKTHNIGYARQIKF